MAVKLLLCIYAVIMYVYKRTLHKCKMFAENIFANCNPSAKLVKLFSRKSFHYMVCLNFPVVINLFSQY